MLVGFFEASARLHPDRVAVEEPGGRRLSYADLEAAATGVARHLLASGLERGDRVGVYFPKSIPSVVSILGILKARCAYVPLDFGAPLERNRHILTDCSASAVCTGAEGARLLATACPDVPRLMVADDGACSTGEVASPGPQAAPPATASDDDLTYILYTSGSTGVPKGVMHTNRSAASFVRWAYEAIAPGPAERFSSHAPFHFDLSIFDLFVCFRSGGTLVLIDEVLGAQPKQLAPFIAEREISIWYSVPSILALLAQHGELAEHDYRKLRVVLFAGEVFPITQLKLLQSFWPDKTYFNLYGPTETNVCTAYRVSGPVPTERSTPLPIGPACDNVRSLVLDERGAPVPKGEPGILHIHASGPTMRGYWQGEGGSPPDPFFVDSKGERWYPTGDVVREDDHGNYLFLGRKDRMVKRRGYRIELGEIENALHRRDDAREVAAVASDAGGRGVEIVAFVVPADPGAKLSVLALKRFCKEHLPGYMCPDRFEFLRELPRTSTDKIDLQHLARLAAQSIRPGS